MRAFAPLVLTAALPDGICNAAAAQQIGRSHALQLIYLAPVAVIASRQMRETGRGQGFGRNPTPERKMRCRRSAAFVALSPTIAHREEE
jgi:hypothetical protein